MKWKCRIPTHNKEHTKGKGSPGSQWLSHPVINGESSSADWRFDDLTRQILRPIQHPSIWQMWSGQGHLNLSRLRDRQTISQHGLPSLIAELGKIETPFLIWGFFLHNRPINRSGFYFRTRRGGLLEIKMAELPAPPPPTPPAAPSRGQRTAPQTIGWTSKNSTRQFPPQTVSVRECREVYKAFLWHF